MTTTPRKFDSEIQITETGNWLFRGQEIIQQNVLEFFKKNIKEDDLGIYIRNSYAELVEHGYIKAKSIFLNISNYYLEDNIIYLVAEDDSITPLKDFYFYSDVNEKIFCMRKSDKYLKFRFNRQTHSYISSLMIEENNHYFLETETEIIPIIAYDKPIDVDIPDLYYR